MPAGGLGVLRNDDLFAGDHRYTEYVTPTELYTTVVTPRWCGPMACNVNNPGPELVPVPTGGNLEAEVLLHTLVKYTMQLALQHKNAMLDYT